MSRRNWSRQETLMELAFYPRPPLPRKNWDDGDAEIKLLAGEIGRTESVVCFRIACLKACDPNRTGLGFTNTAGMGRQVISEYLADPDATMSEAIWSPSRSGFESPTMEKSRPQVLLVPTSHSGSDLSMSSRFARASTRITSAVCFSPTTGAPAASQASTFPPCSRRATSSRGRRPRRASASCLRTAFCSTRCTTAPSTAASSRLTTATASWSPRACRTRPRMTSGSTPSTGGRSPCQAAISRPGRASTSPTTTTTASSSVTLGCVLLGNASCDPNQNRLSYLSLNTSISL